MTLFADLFIKLFTFVLETIGNIATISTCATYFDEPEVPKELTNLKR
ncbi:cyclic lactone autoinducer peptide [Staphylococcus taiwanensis]|nr:cyclic lactone autoinducer peptide [Staphylococcus taiwanensis]